MTVKHRLFWMTLEMSEAEPGNSSPTKKKDRYVRIVMDPSGVFQIERTIFHVFLCRRRWQIHEREIYGQVLMCMGHTQSIDRYWTQNCWKFKVSSLLVRREKAEVSLLSNEPIKTRHTTSDSHYFCKNTKKHKRSINPFESRETEGATE